MTQSLAMECVFFFIAPPCMESGSEGHLSRETNCRLAATFAFHILGSERRREGILRFSHQIQAFPDAIFSFFSISAEGPK